MLALVESASTPLIPLLETSPEPRIKLVIALNPGYQLKTLLIPFIIVQLACSGCNGLHVLLVQLDLGPRRLGCVRTSW